MLVVKNPPASAEDIRDMVQSLSLEDPWKMKWQPTPVFLPAETHEQRGLGVTVRGVAKSWTQMSMHAAR